ncbi:hypothetical protein K469DRAFT_685583 [Zopfia rhizophila CBS 207.26]|uniref:Xylanolytic transcriptional activator regulatory domain-containing protein n=1 Tax=Zopfia rhizophila CBS 207.26 TaxID=1314779 RepID=A0A6A6EA98_9PEZI|nr:hypothetical protein K469DRAFT_685583 [Zopfia rhizophila CBS 207.26]
MGYGQPLESMQFPGMDLNLPTAEPSIEQGYLAPISNRILDSSVHPENGMALVQDILLPVGLPSEPLLIELTELFFTNFYDVFPCFHITTLMEQIRSQYLQTQAPLLLFAICALAARYHQDPSVRLSQNDWYEQAKFQYELTQRDPHPALRAIQTAICLVFHAYTTGDFSAAWLFLGKAWRQACALGLNRIDTDQEGTFSLHRDEPRTDAEKEEHRRVLWLLFIIDRGHSWLTGWPHAINDRQFKVDIPVDEAAFQAMTSETFGNQKPAPFTYNLNSLIHGSSVAIKPLNLFHYLAVAHVILGRIVEQVYSLHDSPNSPEYAHGCDELDSYLAKFRLSLPRSAISLLEASSNTRSHVVWLNTVLNTMTILLHYRPAKLSEPNSEGQNISAEANDHFAHAVIAAKNIVKVVKDASHASIDSVLSAHLGSSFYLASTVLVIRWRQTGDPTLKEDIDILDLVFDRFNEVYSFLGLKFKLALQHDLARSPESIAKLWRLGFRGLLADCSKWTYVQEAVAGKGAAL